eukprot:5481116-Prymnesium_polylepis.1
MLSPAKCGAVLFALLGASAVAFAWTGGAAQSASSWVGFWMVSPPALSPPPREPHRTGQPPPSSRPFSRRPPPPSLPSRTRARPQGKDGTARAPRARTHPRARTTPA